MKRILFFAIVAMMSLVANAQFSAPVSKDRALAATNSRPMKAVSLSDADLWGYFLGTKEEYQGIGFQNQSSGRYDVAIFVPGNSMLAGAKLCGVDMPGFADNVSGITAWAANELGGTKIAETNYTGTYVDWGWSAIPFDEEITIPETGLYVGYSFDLRVSTQYDAYPFPCVQNGAPGSFYIGQNYKNFQDVASQGLTSAMRVYVKDMHFTDNAAGISGVSTEACAVGGKGTAVVYLESSCNNGVQSVDYTLVVNGVETTGSSTLSPAIASGLNKKGSFTIEYDAPAEVGAFPASIAITKVNGVENEAGVNPVAFTVNTVTRVVPRMTVIEEFTGTGCGWCPRGWVGMEAVKHNQSDKALVIAWHKYNTSDAMYQANYANINFSGAPQCTVDRKVYPDPYYGEGEEGIMNCVNKYNVATATVDIKLKANFVDETNKQVYVTSDTEFLTNTNGYTIAYVLTADELTGTTTAWKQQNYYYSNYNKATFTGALPEMPELAEFCRGGEYGKSSVQLVFNDAMIGSSYASTGNSQVPAFTTGQAGDVETSEYTLAMPTKAALVNALNYEKIYVTALVIDKNGEIANAARVRVLGAGEEEEEEIDPTPIVIDGLKISDRTDEMQLMGEAMSPNAKYVVGMNFATFAPAAWNVETNEYVEYPDYEEGAFHAANSNGVLVGDDGFGESFAIKADMNGNLTHLYREEGEIVETEWGSYSTGDAGSSAYAVSEDGKTIAGFYFDSAYRTYPCIWTENNERITLPLPTSEEAGFEVNGGEVRWMTPDGKVLLGMLIDNMGTWPACIWRQNANGGYDVDVICKNYWEEGYQQGKPYMVFNPQSISANGEWVSLSVQAEFDDWDFSAPQPAMQIARLNLTTNTLEVNPDEAGYAPTSIANDGTMLAYTGGNAMMERVGFLWKAGSNDLVNLNDILENVPELEGVGSNTPCSITADGKYVQGFAMDADTNIFSYVMDVANVSDAIEKVAVDNVAPSTKIYNINGQQVRNMNVRGLYIVNGKKIIK